MVHRWSLIAAKLPGRTDNEIKNYWNTHIRRKLLSRGVDPATHRPINEHAPPSKITISFERTQSGDQKNIAGAFVAQDHERSSCSEEESSSSARQQHEEQQQQQQQRRRRPKCPDLNLELRISLPFQEEPMELLSSKKEEDLCFSCGVDQPDNGGAISSSNECKCRDFLGLAIGMLDYRSLEMK